MSHAFVATVCVGVLLGAQGSHGGFRSTSHRLGPLVDINASVVQPGVDGGGPRHWALPAVPVPFTGQGPGTAVAAGRPGSSATAAIFLPWGSPIPTRVLAAYRDAAIAVSRTDRTCHLPWQLLAGIGRIESDHADGGQLFTNGNTLTPILGPLLDGSNGTAVIHDTDHGRWDRNTTWDRAVGPMQFIPSTWEVIGADGNHDGIADPNNIDDATASAAYYLCADQRDLADPQTVRQAIFSYNHSLEYVAAVLAWAAYYSDGPVPTTGSVALAVPPRAPTPAPVPAPDREPSGTPQPSPNTTPTAQAGPPSPTTGPASPAPTACPSSSSSPTPGPTDSSSPTPLATPTPSPTGTISPTDNPAPTPTCDSPTPSPSPSGSIPTPSPSPQSPSVTPAPTP